ncbi:hypothetical protein GCM10007920_30040 [Ciceribacter naphthalenivorans]|uniref:Uncharacterized protein n=2 Tax=Alphaproteobacteria TaxID=28211 RepID=A0A512HQ02_9HYPH|nr:hypothetical protein RNA01_44410 [Ciceribacter naphthalenivorans]GLR23216.1 hypothetical protein GCM10007920_30040 [Ciceribacter naphthalenivorans]GLT06072.1 hypothetical protein GCM10007926_30040 [Sphingomonas psychrolutea]
MKLLGDQFPHAVHPLTTTWTVLLIFGKIIFDTLARQIGRKRSASRFLTERLSCFRQSRIRKFNGVRPGVCKIVAFIRFQNRLFGFIKEAIDTLFASRRKTMQSRQRQLFLKLEDTLVQLLIFRLQRNYLRHQIFDGGLAGSIHPNA